MSPRCGSADPQLPLASAPYALNKAQQCRHSAQYWSARYVTCGAVQCDAEVVAEFAQCQCGHVRQVSNHLSSVTIYRPMMQGLPVRAARALAAYEGSREVSDDHLRRMAPPALRHRLRRNPLDDAGSGTRVARAVDEVFAQAA